MEKDNRGIDPKKHYTLSEAAKLMGVHRTTIWRWSQKLRIRFRIRKVNKRKEFLGADLIKLYQHF